MLRLFTDFQAIGPDGYCWILRHNGADIQEKANSLNISKGDKVILDAHEDFVVIGTLDFKYVEYLGREAWVAYPDWSTRRDKRESGAE
jgi:hypothetical protein